ncbi:hypothetical protein JCM8547_006812 [Rhodosporidiobolus lusitaniae]
MPKQAYQGNARSSGKPYTRPGGPQGRPPRSSESSNPRRFNSDSSTRRPQGKPGAPSRKLEQPKQHSTALDLSNQALAESPADDALAGCQKLNLSNCSLASIAFVRAAAGSLTWLNVSGNDLSAADAWDGIGELKGLFVLNANNCNLSVVPPCVASLSSLKALVLSHNQLKRLEHVSSLPDLNTIVVSNNALTALPSSLSTLPSLKKISAAHNQLTPSGLPDLSSLSHLHEIRLNDNPALTSLPPHFGSWGKAPLPASSLPDPSFAEDARKGKGAEKQRQKTRQGIEILDLGNCGFQSWFGLKELARQGEVVNLGLKGNKVVEEAKEESGFEELKAKLTVLLPSLRILDNVRFDAKFAALKAARESRTEEQKILDAGPMALSLNAKRAEPVKISKEALQDRERERENRKRRKRGEEEVTKEMVEEKKRLKEERRREREAAYLARKAAEGDGEAEGGDMRKEGKRDKGKKRAAEADEVEKEKRKKGKKDRAALVEGTSAPSADEDAPRPPKQKKQEGGVLAALRGDPSETSSSTPAKLPATPAPVPAAPASTVEEKASRPEKTSVAKIVEVKKAGKKKGKKGGDGDEEKNKEDVGALLGLLGAKKEDVGQATQNTEESTSGWGAGSGTGVFGGGGWD